MIDKNSFIEVFETSFWRKLNRSIVPFNDGVIEKKGFLGKLHEEIVNYSYTPSPPREYIVYNKHNNVPRYVPSFTRKDACVYYFCIKLLEEELAINRVAGTFGGWSLGNLIRLKEETEIIDITYVPMNATNPYAWANQWINFQNVVRLHAKDENFKYFLKLDIANFYDSIDLNILERKIRHAVDKTKQNIVTLLIHFLSNWNKKLEGYSAKKMGIPQEDIGDCSRILANFFLQDYDLAMKHFTRNINAEYVRFSDDQIFYVREKKDIKKILSESSKNFFAINLSINSSKVKEYIDRKEFFYYWAFEIFDLLDDHKNQIKINKAVDKYFEYRAKGIQFRSSSILKKMLGVNFELLTNERKKKLLKEFQKPEFLTTLTFWHLEKLKPKVGNNEEFFKRLDECAENTLYNSFLYNLMGFYTRNRKDYDCAILEKRIKQLEF